MSGLRSRGPFRDHRGGCSTALQKRPSVGRTLNMTRVGSVLSKPSAVLRCVPSPRVHIPRGYGQRRAGRGGGQSHRGRRRRKASTEAQRAGVGLHNKVFRAASKTGVHYSVAREEEGNNRWRGDRKRAHCLPTLPVWSVAVASAHFQVLFSSSVVFSASYACFTAHEN